MEREYHDAARSRTYRPGLQVRVHSCAFVVKKISHARKNAWLSSDLPSAALPASGSRGSSTTSQPFGSPALSREATARGAEVNASKHGAWNCEIGVGEKDLVAPRSLL